MELYEMLPDFRDESLDWLELMSSSLVYLGFVPGCRAAVNNVHFAIDALRESAGLFGLDHVVELAQAMKDAVIRMDSDSEQFDRASIPLLLSCCDHMKVLIEQTDPDWVSKELFESDLMEQALLRRLGEYDSPLQARAGY